MELLVDGSPRKVTEVGHEQKFPNWLLQVIKTSSKHLDEYNGLVYLADYDQKAGAATSHQQNYAGYLETCSQLQVGAVIRPDIFYFTVVNEIAANLLANNGPSCLQATSAAGDPDNELSQVLDSIVDKMPQKMAKLLQPTFSTDDDRSIEARLACFSEEPGLPSYRQTVTSFTGIKKFRLEGTLEDWSKIVDAIKGWLEEVTLPKTAIHYLEMALKIGEKIVSELTSGTMTPGFWKAMYPSRHEVDVADCGYLSTHPHGWIGDLFNQRTRSDPSMFDSHVTRVEWVSQPNGRKTVVYHGLFSSNLGDDGYLVPSFCRVKFEVK